MLNIRQQFEEEYWKYGLPWLVVGSKESVFAIKEDGEYKIPHVAGAFWAWSAAKEYYKSKSPKD